MISGLNSQWKSRVRLARLGRGLAFLAILALAFQPFIPVNASRQENTVASWALYQVDSYHNFLNLTDRSLRFDSNGRPHIAYGGKNLYYAHYDGTNWQNTIVDNAPGVGEYAAIALDSSNRPYISYYDDANRSLKLAYLVGQFWTIMTVDTPGNNALDLAPENLHRLNAAEDSFQVTADPNEAVGMYSSIAIDKNNVVHITYFDTFAVNPKNTPGILKYARWDGVTWEVGTTIDSRNSTGKFTSVAIKPNSQQPCVSYLNELYDDLMYACRGTNGSWSQETVEAAGNIGAYTSLAFDTGSSPYISYYDFGNGDLKYASKKSGSWSTFNLDTNGDVGLFTSIAVRPSDNRVYISYVDKTNKRIRYANSSDWSLRTLENLKDQGQYTSIAIDKNGRPGIVYYSTENATLYYAHWDGNSWSKKALDVAGDVGLGSSITVNAAGNPYVSYQNATSLDLKYGFTFNYTWHKNNILTTGYNVGSFTSIKLDSNGRPVIAYHDLANGDLKLASWNGSAWEVRTVDGSSENVGLYVSLALDTQNRPHLSYYDATKQDLKYAFWTGSAWDIRVLDFGGNVGQYSAIALDASNRPFISYYDATNGDLKMAYKSPTDAWITYPPVDTVGDVGRHTSISVDGSGQPHISYYDATNQDLKYAMKTGDSWWIEAVDTTGNTGLYTSIVVDSLYNSHISYYDASSGDLRYAYGNPGFWSPETIAANGVVGLFTSIDVNKDNQPVISYYDYTMGELWVAMSYPLPGPSNMLYLPWVSKK